MGATLLDSVSSCRSVSVEEASRLSSLPGVAYSLSDYETRLRAYRDASNTFFPGVRAIERMDFIYAK